MTDGGVSVQLIAHLEACCVLLLFEYVGNAEIGTRLEGKVVLLYRVENRQREITQITRSKK